LVPLYPGGGGRGRGGGRGGKGIQHPREHVTISTTSSETTTVVPSTSIPVSLRAAPALDRYT
jgi:hypothetical protein